MAYQVTTNADSGAGSLRQTIIDAPAGSTITFDPSLAGQTITLGGSAMTINKALTISGFELHPGITLDANQASRVFHVSPTGSLTLQGLTVTGGNGVGTPASGFGGAILTEGILLASHCLFIGNSTTLDGGAISGNCDLINCTFTENSAERNGSAVVMGNGSLHHCTVTNNQSNPSLSGAVYGFLNSGSVVTIANCIVAENSPNDIWVQGGGQIVFAGRNIAASTGSIVGPLPFTGPAPLTDSPALALLGNYGGPTLSRPPVPGSPAIDAALPAAVQPIDDQRGAFRNPGVSDIGAVEYQPAIVNTVSDQNDSPEGPELSLREALAREFISSVTFDPAVFNGEPEDTIILSNGQLVLEKSVNLLGYTGGSITIDANGASTGHRALHVTEAVVAAEFWDMNFTGGTTPLNPELNGESGGGILNEGNLILNSCVVFENTTGSGAAGAPGGGIFNSGQLSIRGGSVHGNTTGNGSASPGGDGAGIFSSGSLEIRDGASIHGNSTGTGISGGNGGGIANIGSLNVLRSTIANNQTGMGLGGPGGHGGGVFSRGPLSMSESTISGCSTGPGSIGQPAGNGGGLWTGGLFGADAPSVAIHSCTIANNLAATGGGVFSSGPGSAGFSMISSTVSGNTAGLGGGMINSLNGFDPQRSIIAGNDAPQDPDFSGVLLLGSFNELLFDPHLAPLGDYGGPTQTMPPLPGSPVINAADSTDPGGTDQRGLPRFVGGALDIGAVESQGTTADLATFWNTDWDGDGIPYGIERALGNDPFIADPNEEGNLTVPQFNPSGHATLSFRIGDAARADTIWILQRSPDLSPGSWQEIYRYDGPAFQETIQQDIDAFWTATITPNTTFAHVTDQSPPPGKGFYRFVAELAAP